MSLLAWILVSLSFYSLFLSFGILDAKNQVPVLNETFPFQLSNPPAKRVVLVVVDGLGSDTFHDYVSGQTSGYNIFDNIIKVKGTYGDLLTSGLSSERYDIQRIASGVGVAHTSLFFPEPSNNIVDTIFNYTNTYYFGPPEIPEYFAPQSKKWWKKIVSYNEHNSDRLDRKVFEEVHYLFKDLTQNVRLAPVYEDKSLFFVFVKGFEIDHKNTPLLDDQEFKLSKLSTDIKNLNTLFKTFYGDSKTAFIFIGINSIDKDPQGLGKTPFLAWGAGVSKPCFTGDIYRGYKKAFGTIKRRDIHQIDLAPMISCLLRTPVPFHAVGVNPSEQLRITDNQYMVCLAFKTLQVSNLLRAHEMEASTLGRTFSPFKKGDWDELLNNVTQSEEKMDHTMVKVIVSNLTCQSLAAIKYYEEFMKRLCVYLIIFMLVSWFLWLCTVIISRNNIPLNPNPGETHLQRIYFWLEKNTAEIVMSVILLVGVFLFLIHSPKTKIAFLCFYPMVSVTMIVFWYTLTQNKSWSTFFSNMTSKHMSGILKAGLINVLLLELFMLTFGDRSSMNIMLVVILLYMTFVEIRVEHGSRIGDWLITVIPLIILMVTTVSSEDAFLTFILPATFLWTFLAVIFFLYAPLTNKDTSFIIFCVLSICVALFHTGIQIITENSDESPKIMKYIMISTSFLPMLALPFAASDKLLIRLFQVGLCMAVTVFAVSAKQEPLAYFFISLHLLCWLLIEAFGDSSVLDLKYFEVKNITNRIRRYPGTREARAALTLVVYIYIFFFVMGFRSHKPSEGLQIIPKVKSIAMAVQNYLAPAVKLFSIIFTSTVIHAYLTRVNGAPVRKTFLVVCLFLIVSCLHTTIVYYQSIATESEKEAIHNLFIVSILAFGVIFIYPLSAAFSILPSAGPPPSHEFQMHFEE